MEQKYQIIYKCKKSWNNKLSTKKCG